MNENEARELYERERDAAAGSMPTVTNKEEKKTWAWNELQDPSCRRTSSFSSCSWMRGH